MYPHYSFQTATPNPFRQQNANHLKVFGEGTVTATPNQAVVTLGVVTEDPSLTTAQQTNAKAMAQVINSLRNKGIPQTNIQTVDYSIHMQYDYQNGQQIFRGYQVSNIIQVTLDDINQIGEIVDLAVSSGANVVRNIQLRLKDEQQHYKQALSKAIQNGKDKALQIANSLGVSLEPTPSRIKEILEPKEIRPKEVVLGVSTDQASFVTPIEPGLLNIKATLEMVFHY